MARLPPGMQRWLLEQGFEAPFLDFDKHSGIPPGANWEQVLYRVLTTSQAVLLLLSAQWQASKWCFAEFTQARALGKPVLPVIVGPLADDVELVAADVQTVDLRSNTADSLDRLRRQLAKIALTSQGGLPWDGRRPPYPGLAALEPEDAALYFGREPEIRQVVERLTARRSLGGSSLLVVLGASGAGKSSLLRAGVVPRLRHSGHQWVVPPPLRPQRRPLDSLALTLSDVLGDRLGWRDLSDQMRDALRSGTQHAWLTRLANDLREAAAASEASILLAIDQAEELFHQSEAEERQGFLHLLNAALSEGMPYLAVMALRSDALAALQSDREAGAAHRSTVARAIAGGAVGGGDSGTGACGGSARGAWPGAPDVARCRQRRLSPPVGIHLAGALRPRCAGSSPHRQCL
jgi:hypothetical protein